MVERFRFLELDDATLEARSDGAMNRDPSSPSWASKLQEIIGNYKKIIGRHKTIIVSLGFFLTFIG